MQQIFHTCDDMLVFCKLFYKVSKKINTYLTANKVAFGQDYQYEVTFGQLPNGEISLWFGPVAN